MHVRWLKLPVFIIFYTVFIILLMPERAYAMHIMEGFLPITWCGIWYALTIPFFVMGMISINKLTRLNPKLKLLLAFAGAFAFALSALKIPSLGGSCSHPTGVGLGAILFGPVVMSVLGSVVLLFQALLLGHGGITTLGANAFSMAVAGPVVAYSLFKACRKIGAPLWLAVFMGTAFGDMMTYIIASLQLALGIPLGNMAVSFIKYASVFALTQIPLAISEGLLTVFVFNLIYNHDKSELQELTVIPGEVR